MNTIAIKAGMDKIDKAKVEAIIEKMSRDSPHYEKVRNFENFVYL